MKLAVDLVTTPLILQILNGRAPAQESRDCLRNRVLRRAVSDPDDLAQGRAKGQEHCGQLQIGRTCAHPSVRRERRSNLGTEAAVDPGHRNAQQECGSTTKDRMRKLRHGAYRGGTQRTRDECDVENGVKDEQAGSNDANAARTQGKGQQWKQQIELDLGRQAPPDRSVGHDAFAQPDPVEKGEVGKPSREILPLVCRCENRHADGDPIQWQDAQGASPEKTRDRSSATLRISREHRP